MVDQNLVNRQVIVNLRCNGTVLTELSDVFSSQGIRYYLE